MNVGVYHYNIYEVACFLLALIRLFSYAGLFIKFKKKLNGKEYVHIVNAYYHTRSHVIDISMIDQREV